MTYIVIDTDGALDLRINRPTSERITTVVGYWDTVRLPVLRDGGAGDQFSARGWVSDTGLIDGSPRNVAGSLLLAAFGAPAQPYAGPVVITGWDEYTETESLSGYQVGVLIGAHECITGLLAGDHTACEKCPTWWREAMVELAARVRDEPVRPLQFLHGDEALEALNRMGGNS